MKTSYLCAAMVAIAASFTACQSTPDIQGEWLSSQPQRLDTGSGSDTQMLTRIVFTPDASNIKSGKVVIASDINVVDGLPLSEVLVEPYQITITARAQISGTYEFEDEDDMTISLDQSSLEVSVDPLAHVSRENTLSPEQAPEVDALKSAMIEKYKTLIERSLAVEYGKYHRLEDVELKSNGHTLKFEVSDQDQYYTRVTDSK